MPAPMTIEKMQYRNSIVVTGLISPYPTEVMDVVAQCTPVGVVGVARAAQQERGHRLAGRDQMKVFGLTLDETVVAFAFGSQHTLGNCPLNTCCALNQ